MGWVFPISGLCHHVASLGRNELIRNIHIIFLKQIHVLSKTMKSHCFEQGYKADFRCFSIFPVFFNHGNTNNLLRIAFISGRSDYSCAVMTPVRYGSDLIYLTGNICLKKTIVNGEINQRKFSNLYPSAI